MLDFPAGGVSPSKAEIDAFLAGGCQDGGDDEPPPPPCVAACDWSTGCPAVCDTSACPAEAGEESPSKAEIDAFLAGGCQEGGDDEDSVQCGTDAGRDRACEHCDAHSAGDGRCDSTDCRWDPDLQQCVSNAPTEEEGPPADQSGRRAVQAQADAGPPECVAACDWSNDNCPAECDTSGCPEEGERNRAVIDAYLAAGCVDASACPSGSFNVGDDSMACSEGSGRCNNEDGCMGCEHCDGQDRANNFCPECVSSDTGGDSTDSCHCAEIECVNAGFTWTQHPDNIEEMHCTCDGCSAGHGDEDVQGQGECEALGCSWDGDNDEVPPCVAMCDWSEGNCPTNCDTSSCPDEGEVNRAQIDWTCDQGAPLGGGGTGPGGAEVAEVGVFVGTACTPNECSATEVAFSDKADVGSITGVTGDVITVTCELFGGGPWTCGSDGMFTGTICSVTPPCPYPDGPVTFETPSGDTRNCAAPAVFDRDAQCAETVCADSDFGDATTNCCQDPLPCTAAEVPNSDYSELASITGVTYNVVVVTCNEGYSGGGDWICQLDTLFAGSACTANACAAVEVANSDSACAAPVMPVCVNSAEVPESCAHMKSTRLLAWQESGSAELILEFCGPDYAANNWPPACVAACDWGTDPDWVCPDPTACDTTDCPTDGEHSKDRLDAFLAGGCQEGGDDEDSVQCGTDAGRDRACEHCDAHSAGDGRCDSTDCHWDPDLQCVSNEPTEGDQSGRRAVQAQADAGPPECVAACDWSNDNCPAECDTSGCPEEGERNRAVIDAYLAAGCVGDSTDSCHCAEIECVNAGFTWTQHPDNIEEMHCTCDGCSAGHGDEDVQGQGECEALGCSWDGDNDEVPPCVAMCDWSEGNCPTDCDTSSCPNEGDRCLPVWLFQCGRWFDGLQRGQRAVQYWGRRWLHGL